MSSHQLNVSNTVSEVTSTHTHTTEGTDCLYKFQVNITAVTLTMEKPTDSTTKFVKRHLSEAYYWQCKIILRTLNLQSTNIIVGLTCLSFYTEKENNKSLSV